MAARVGRTDDCGQVSPPSTQLSNLWVVEEVALGDLQSNPAPQRRHGERKITRLMGAIEAFGQLPLLVSEALMVLDGQAVVEACRRLGRQTVSVIRVTHLTTQAQRALMMAVNRLGEDAKWDLTVLKTDFQVMLADPQIDFDLDVTGFDQVYIDGTLMGDEEQAQDDLPEPPATPVTQSGDLWRCGVHRVLCGDSLLAKSFEELMAQERAQLALSDVPYNVAISTVSGQGKAKHDEFAMASGEMDRAAFVEFQKTVFKHCHAAALDGALAYFFIDGRHVRDQIEAGEAVFGKMKQLVVWVKDNPGMGSFYRSGHELITIWKCGQAAHINNFGLGGSGRHRSNVWTYPGMSSLGKGRAEALSWHPTVKPLALMADAILDVTRRGDLVLDPFGGSGTTMMAAQRTGRRACLIEIEPKYVDVTLQRFLAETGEEPLLQQTGERLSQVAARRAVEASSPVTDDWDIL